MIYLFDKSQKLIGFLNEKEELTKAQLTLKINEAATLDLELPANSENLSEVQNVKYVAVPYPDDNEKLLFLQVMTRTDEQDIVTLMAKEYAYQELSTSGYIKDKRYTNSDARTLMTGALSNSGYTLKNVNVSGSTTTNFYYIDYLTAISNVIDLLGGEVKFYVTVDGNQISGKYVDYVIAQGVNTSKVFAYGSNLISIEKQSDASSVYTAILPRGKGELVSKNDNGPDGYGRRITIEGVTWTKPTNPLNKPAGSLILEDPSATAAFGQVNGTARLLLQTYDDIESPQELIQAAYKDLQSYNHPAVQFTASVANIGDSGLGDTIVIMHKERGMSYRTRIFQIEYDLIELGNTVATFGDNLSKNNTSSMLASVSRAVDNAKEVANNAIISANSINNNYYGQSAPANPKNGDTWFYTDGEGFGIRQYVDGQWIDYVNSKTSEQIASQVDTAIKSAQSYADSLDKKQSAATKSLASDLATKADELTKGQQNIASQATAYTNSAVADANAKAIQIGQTTAQNAQSALNTAKSSLSSAITSQATTTKNLVSAVDSNASKYATQAKSEAVSAAQTADGVIQSDFKKTTNSISTTITQNKSEADGKIKTAQTTATQALDGLATKVSQTEYNAKTGRLQTDLTETTQTANQAKTDIVSIKQKDGDQDARMTKIESDASGVKQTVSDLQTVQGKQSGDISTLQQRADGFDATVTKVNNLAVGGRNLLQGTGTASGDVANGFVTLVRGAFNGYDAVKTNTAWSGRFINLYQALGRTNAKAGDWYTISVYVKADKQIDTGFLDVYRALGNGDADTNDGFLDGIQMNVNPITTQWQQYSWSFQINDISLKRQNTRVEYNYATDDNWIYWAGWKLERGNIATEWTPAPEDLSSATAKAQLTADNATLAINNYKIDADGRISKAQADIVANANAITQKVSQSDYNAKTGELTQSASKAQQTADTATQTIGTYKETNDKRVASAETNIKANADAISLTASKSELDNATGELKSEISEVKLTADGLYETVNNPTNGIATRLLTAEGTITTVKNATNELTSKQTLTANGLTQEISDRKTGDNNTLQAGKDFTTSQITSYDTGMQSRLSQVSDGIMAQVSAINLITDSSFINGIANWNKFGNGVWAVDGSNSYYGINVVSFYDFNHTGKNDYLTSQDVYTNAFPSKKIYAYVDVNVSRTGGSGDDFVEVYIVQYDNSGTQVKFSPITNQIKTSTNGWKRYTQEIDVDQSATRFALSYHASGNIEAYIARPYAGVTKLTENGYIAGPNNTNRTNLSLFYNFFSLGIQSNTGALISGINGDSSGLNIVGKKITVSGDTTFIGNNFMDGAIIKNASIGSAQIADAAITNAKISNLDVNKLSGNISSFIQTNWNGKYGSTKIDANGMTVDTSGVTTKFGNYGMELNMTGESVGGIGVQGLTGKPSDYQGLAFWLDGQAEYMAWGARNNGQTSGNPVLKLSWFRINSAPSGAYSGFNFDDDVIFNRGINVPGDTNRRIIFATKNFQNYNYPYFGDSQGQAGWAFGGSQIYMLSGTTYYNATKVIAALNGIGAAKIPTEINSDGTVKKWANVTL